MILLVHLVFGAAIGASIRNAPLAIVLAFLSHYFLDTIPHIEYPVSVHNKRLKRIYPDGFKIIADFLAGLFIVALFSGNQPIIYVCGFAAIIPDIIFALTHITLNKIFQIHEKIHDKIHFLHNKKISIFWRILSQAVVVVISIILLSS